MVFFFVINFFFLYSPSESILPFFTAFLLFFRLQSFLNVKISSSKNTSSATDPDDTEIASSTTAGKSEFLLEAYFLTSYSIQIFVGVFK